LGKVISSVSASAGIQVRQTATVQPPVELAIGTTTTSTNEIRSSQQTHSYPVSVSVSWAPRITTNVAFSKSSSMEEQAGNLTRNDREDASADLSFTFRPPKEMLPLPSDVRTALRYASNRTDGCITLAGSDGCIPIASSSRRQFNFSMDTNMPPNVSAGLSIGYILTEDATINRKFAQFVITAAVTVNFRAGDLR
jgi:hypothetical protein